MSSNSYTASCPVCENVMDVCKRNRPFPQTDCRCRTCGFSTHTCIGRTDLEDINDNREEGGEELITKKEYNKYNDHPLFNDNINY